jgi:hypothetical protein
VDRDLRAPPKKPPEYYERHHENASRAYKPDAKQEQKDDLSERRSGEDRLR